MPGAATATIAAISVGLMIGRHWNFGPHFRRRNDRGVHRLRAIAGMRGRMCMRNAMGSCTGHRKCDQQKSQQAKQ
jgi:hypothetical protein